ncbi:hypothetical protein [Xanthomonas arboricola]|uniref:hypothetical protein n=1 Tax=Xanthomonas arboricola TaxID=56448 RepID=UPI0013781589|nr:hypothetical protein [Xanthomonas arboricola]
MILLYPMHHTEIDKNEADWPVEKLHHLKSTHEFWVRQTLADSANQKTLAGQVSVTSIIDAAIKRGPMKWGQVNLRSQPETGCAEFGASPSIAFIALH